MKRAKGAVLLVLVALAGCSGGRTESVGFTGLGSEAASVTRTDPTARLDGGTLSSDIPRSTVRSGSFNRMDHAETAIRRGGSGGNRAKPVVVGGQTLALSIVAVNGAEFAVLKPPSGLFAPGIAPETAAAFAARSRALTGCDAQSRVYAYGPAPNRPQGLTLVLGCG